MKNKKEIIQLFNKKLKTLKTHNNHYYGYDNPKITDSEYDNLKKEIYELKKNYSFLDKNKAVTYTNLRAHET